MGSLSSQGTLECHRVQYPSDDLNGGANENLGGPAYTIDKALGGDGFVGGTLDVFSGGVPKTGFDATLFGIQLVMSPGGQLMFNGHSQFSSGVISDPFILRNDNTNTYLNNRQY